MEKLRKLLMKKSYLFLVFCLVISVAVFSQQRPYYTQYILNNFIINPAVAGIENYTDIKLSHRQQWVGINDAPATTYFTFHKPLKRGDYDVETATSSRPMGQNPRGSAYWQNYEAAEPHHGIGFTFINDRTGPLVRTALTATYAYHIGLGPQTNLSAGISAGFSQMRLDAAKLDFGDIDVDPAVSGAGILNRFRPDISAGLWLYSKNYFVGLAAQQIVAQNLTFSDNTVGLQGGRLVPHIFLSAGYRMMMGEDFVFLPSMQLRYISGIPVDVDLNLKWQYQDIFWVGGSARLRTGFAAMAGMNISNNLNIGYSYDLSTGRLGTVTRGTHEIVIGFLLNNRYGDWCPRALW